MWPENHLSRMGREDGCMISSVRFCQAFRRSLQKARKQKAAFTLLDPRMIPDATNFSSFFNAIAPRFFAQQSIACARQTKQDPSISRREGPRTTRSNPVPQAQAVEQGPMTMPTSFRCRFKTCTRSPARLRAASTGILLHVLRQNAGSSPGGRRVSAALGCSTLQRCE